MTRWWCLLFSTGVTLSCSEGFVAQGNEMLRCGSARHYEAASVDAYWATFMVARRDGSLALFLDVSEMNGDTGDKINSCPF